MSDKPLETPFTEFSEEEIAAMGEEEMFSRAVFTAGDLGVMVEQIAIEASEEIMDAIQQGRLMAAAFGEGSEGSVVDLVAEHIHASVLAAMGVARKLESFAADNPQFADTEPLTLSGILSRERELQGQLTTEA